VGSFAEVERALQMFLPRLAPVCVRAIRPQLTLLSPIDYTALVVEKEIKKLELQNGLVPFDEWFDSLRNRKMQAAVDTRLTRVRAGNFRRPQIRGWRRV
jgi:hypothetical protein